MENLWEHFKKSIDWETIRKWIRGRKKLETLKQGCWGKTYEEVEESPFVVASYEESSHPKKNILKEEDNNLGDEESLCVICICNPVTHAAIPCGHYSYCLHCINLNPEKEFCAICRGPVNTYCKIYK
jgi:Zinc finger, C3HC4 type (RING finger)